MNEIEKRDFIYSMVLRFPYLRANLSKVLLFRKSAFIDSGLYQALKRCLFLLQTEKHTSIDNDIALFLNLIYKHSIEWSEIATKDCKDVKYTEISNTDCDIIFNAWITAVKNIIEGDHKYFLEICKNYNSNIEEIMRDVYNREYQLKDILSIYALIKLFDDKNIFDHVKCMVVRICEYFEEEDKDIHDIYCHVEKRNIANIIAKSRDVTDVMTGIERAHFKYYSRLQNCKPSISHDIRTKPNKISACIKRSNNPIEENYYKLYGQLIPVIDEVVYLNFILESSVFFMYRKNYLPRHKNIEAFIEHFITILKLGLELVCFQSAFNRTSFALRNEEIIRILFYMLSIDKDDIFLDMFANIPVVSTCASLLGARTIANECDFVEKDRYSDSFEKMQKRQRDYVNSLLRITDNRTQTLEYLINMPIDIIIKYFQIENILGGTIERNRVYENGIMMALQQYSLFFKRILRENMPILSHHKFSLEEDIKPNDSLNFSNGYFNKILLDPPFGRETASDGFGPKEGYIIARKGLVEASRLLRSGGYIVMTLPSYKWLEFKEMKWRENIISEAKQLQLQQVNDDLGEGRSLLLLQKP